VPTNQPFQRVHSRYERVTGSPLGENVLGMVDYADFVPLGPQCDLLLHFVSGQVARTRSTTDDQTPQNLYLPIRP